VTAANTVTLPIEVLGNGSPAAPVVSDVSLAIPAGRQSDVVELWLRCHRCGIYGAPEFEAVTALPPKVPASIRILGGLTDTAQINAVRWIDLTDTNLTLPDPERLAGGLNGGFYTVRMTLVLDAATRARLVGLPQLNRVQFRFSGTDGESNGFRIIGVEWRDAAHRDLGANSVVWTDPQVEQRAGAAWNADADRGKTLWYAPDTLTKSTIVGRKIHASCSSCHEEAGRDLQYFNYSNKAIVQRARFHGLSEDLGRQIAAYIRYSQQSVPYADKARPWNPPYQPGPGLDAADINQWSAGAGLDAVLDTPAQAVSALFGRAAPSAITQADVDRVMDPAATMNAREIPVALQFPDWNAWLPAIHPSDVWPDDGSLPEGSFEGGARFASSTTTIDPLATLAGAATWLETHKSTTPGDWSKLSVGDRASIKDKLYQVGWEAYRFLGGIRGDHINRGTTGRYGAEAGASGLKRFAAPANIGASRAPAFTDAAFMERATSSMMQWEAVKQWELVQKYALEGDQTQLQGDVVGGAWRGRGEKRGWNLNTPGLFYLAPHMLYQKETVAGRVREWYFAWEANQIAASYYRTNQWYQLQMVVNAGARGKFTNYPMDWPYLLRFDQLLADEVWENTPAGEASATTHYIRALQGRIKLAQHVNNDVALYDPAQPNLLNNVGFISRAEAAKHLAPSNFEDAGTSAALTTPLRLLDELAPGLYLKILNGSVLQFNRLYAGTDPAKWRRCVDGNTDLGSDEPYAGFAYCLDKTPRALLVDSTGAYYLKDGKTSFYQTNAYGYLTAKAIGIEATRLATWKQWIDRAWPPK
jgi:hypothetical protein